MRGGSDLASTKEFDEWVRSITSKLGGTPQKKLRGRSRPTGLRSINGIEIVGNGFILDSG
jgi:hypothetical protein